MRDGWSAANPTSHDWHRKPRVDQVRYQRRPLVLLCPIFDRLRPHLSPQRCCPSNGLSSTLPSSPATLKNRFAFRQFEETVVSAYLDRRNDRKGSPSDRRSDRYAHLGPKRDCSRFEAARLFLMVFGLPPSYCGNTKSYNSSSDSGWRAAPTLRNIARLGRCCESEAFAKISRRNRVFMS